MTRPWRFGVVAGLEPPDSRAAWLERVRRIDGLGYDVLLMPDHLGIWPPLTPLVAAAEASERLRFGTQVLNNEFWNPVLLAREAAAADVLTDGRLELGFGAGHAQDEFTAAGIAYERPGLRIDRLAQAVPLVRRLLVGEQFTHGGAYRLRDAALGIAPSQSQVPIMVGGNGDRVLTVAAQHADIVSLVGFTSGTGRTHTDLSHFTWVGLADRLALIETEAEERSGSIERSLLVQHVAVTDSARSVAEEWAVELGQPAERFLDTPFLLIGSVERLAGQLIRLREEHGVTYVTVFAAAAEALAPVVERLR